MARSTFFLLFCSAVTLVGCGGSDNVSIGNSGEPTPETSATDPASPSGETSVPSGSASATADDPKPEAPSKPNPPAPGAKPKRVFVTAQSYKGNLRDQVLAPDGFQAGDKICQAEAKNLGGTWKAFLSGKMKGQALKAADRLNDVGAWYLVDGTTKVFDGKAGLAAAPLARIDMLADGKKTTSDQAWTGTKLGQVGASCEDMGGTSWASSSVFKSGTNGNPLEVTLWSDDGSSKGCSEAAPLYCFEQ